jgi:hypothetical protein
MEFFSLWRGTSAKWLIFANEKPTSEIFGAPPAVKIDNPIFVLMNLKIYFADSGVSVIAGAMNISHFIKSGILYNKGVSGKSNPSGHMVFEVENEGWSTG